MAGENKIGLVLSGGGTRGLAHIGAWRGLSSIGFQPAAIAGCSMGAIIGAMIAAGKTPDEMETFVVNQKVLSLFQWPITKLGLANLSKFETMFFSWLGTRRFEGLDLPLIVNATDLVAGERVIYDRGLLWPAIRASISIPGFFAPIRAHNEVIVDGGVLDEHPFDLLPKHIQRFILVNCSPRENMVSKQVNALGLLQASLNVMQNEITQLRLASIPLHRYAIIEPRVHGRYLVEGVKKFKELIDLGSTAAETKLADIQRLLTSR